MQRRIVFAIVFLGIMTGGCTSALQDAGRSASEGVFDGVEAWWKAKEPELLAKADKARADAEVLALGKIEAVAGRQARDAVEASLPTIKATIAPMVDDAINRGERAVLSKMDEKVKDLAAKQDRGEPLTTWEWLLLMLLGSGGGAGAIAMLKATLRSALGLKIPVERVNEL